MERVYKLAMFPNGDGDTQRDKIYSDSVARLAANVTPNHRLVLITVLVAYPTSYFSISWIVGKFHRCCFAFQLNWNHFYFENYVTFICNEQRLIYIHVNLWQCYEYAVNFFLNYRKLRIPAVYHLEAPWSSAQAQLIKINAFKTPRDKIQVW